MQVKRDKCLNCGASIDYNKIENGVYRCPYCREYYHIDQYGYIEEYKVKLKYMGRTVYCYLGSVEFEPICVDSYRTLDGMLSTTIASSEPVIKFELISYKIEDSKESKGE